MSETPAGLRPTMLSDLDFVLTVEQDPGCRSRHRSVELKRMAFRDLQAHRFWLDVKTHNVRAKALYGSEGFVEEGRLRECVKTEQGCDSLVVMSLLESEYHARVDAGIEEAAA